MLGQQAVPLLLHGGQPPLQVLQRPPGRVIARLGRQRLPALLVQPLLTLSFQAGPEGSQRYALQFVHVRLFLGQDVPGLRLRLTALLPLRLQIPEHRLQLPRPFQRLPGLFQLPIQLLLSAHFPSPFFRQTRRLWLLSL